MSSAFLSGFTIKIGDGASSETFNTLTEAFSITGLGQTNDLVDVTNFDSAGSREFISGLADGQEFTIECNRVQGDTYQNQARTDVVNKTNRNWKITVTDGTTSEDFDFLATMLSWGETSSPDDKAIFTVTAKISGAITIT